MLALLIPILGLGAEPTLIVLTFYALYPILRTTYMGLKSVPPECIEAANGLGFSNFQKLWHVELPLALPMILSGIRLATASTIGIATIAAFIGAGGLGDFITQGLALNDWRLILLGAIPTAFLALGFDYGISQFEDYLHHREKSHFKLKVLGSFCALFLIFYGVQMTFFSKEKNILVIGSKNFSEQNILAEIMAQLIENKTTLQVVRKLNLGTTAIVHQALLKGDIDLYPEYDGTAYLTVLQRPWDGKEKDVFNKVKESYKHQFHLLWLDPFGFSNSQSLAVKKEIATKYHLRALSDLVPFSDTLVVASPPEFIQRQDALPSLRKAYGFKFKDILQVCSELMYVTVNHGLADIVASFTTDGRLKGHDFVILKDDKNIYPPYHAAPVMREDIDQKYPQVEKVLSSLAGLISEQQMIDLNYEVSEGRQTPAEVAYYFLETHHLLSKE
ncbi:MAG: hypothetical protein ACD_16C00089G0002 [uncultured bacterium]|nr:MAG: hypothetical protein ACD_16C00089G0002 [uncultured bacterium]